LIRVYHLTAVPAPRQVSKDAWNPSPPVQRYRAFRDLVRITHVQIPRPFHHVVFVMAMPPSWSKAKRLAMEGQLHEQKPDRDNLEKALLDSVFGEDCDVADGRATKLWGTQDLIIIGSENVLPVPITTPVRLQPFYEQHDGLLLKEQW
jgi:Holliday junction resolvase RusA-like endonuclease